jgi:hypothetical protein
MLKSSRDPSSRTDISSIPLTLDVVIVPAVAIPAAAALPLTPDGQFLNIALHAGR